jgi:YD repeat-containing protein
VNFYYHSSGLLAKVVVPWIDPDSLAYDGTRGNVNYHRASNGAVSNTYTDAAGRDTLLTVPINGSNSGWVKNVYDVMDRVILTRTWGPQLGSTPDDTTTVEFEYDKEGNQTYVRRYPGRYTGNYSTQVSQYQYDAAGRMQHESHPGRGISYYFGDGVNVTQRSTILGDITMKYDAAGRLVRRIVPQKTYGPDPCSNWITQFTCYFSFPTTGASSVCVPADTARFAYDASGRILRADNGRARVRRSYKPNGLIAEDSLRIRTYHSPGASPCENPNPRRGPVHITASGPRTSTGSHPRTTWTAGAPSSSTRRATIQYATTTWAAGC